MALDDEAGNALWLNTEWLELDQTDEFEMLIDLRPKEKAKIPKGYKKICVHLVYDVKHDGRHKGWLVADGHLIEVPSESVYSSVVSFRGIRIVAFLAELNGLNLWGTDIGNAYLQSYMKEKVYIVAGAEFGD